MKFLTIALAGASLAACTAPADSTAASALEPIVAPVHALEIARVSPSVHGDGFALTVAAPTGDPIERWGLCLARVADCYVPGANAIDRDACLRQTDRAPATGENQCPRACRVAFEAANRQLHDVEAAVDASYKKGSCVDGFLTMSEGASRHLELDPHAFETIGGGAR